MSAIPFKPSPWHVAHGTVRPESPVFASISPLLMLPFGTYAMNPDVASRNIVRLTSSGTSMMRIPIGSLVPVASTS